MATYSTARMTGAWLISDGLRRGASARRPAFRGRAPAAILARLLGIHIDVAVAWQRICAGDWMTYAADVSRRRED